MMCHSRRLPIKNKDNYIHFKLSNMSHINDPMMKLKANISKYISAN